MNIFSNTNTIRSRVMDKVNALIEEAEKNFILDCKEIDEQAKIDKEHAADKHVKALVGKVI